MIAGSQPVGRKWGLTKPVSEVPASELDLKLSKDLEHVLRDKFQLFEGQAEVRKREEVLGRLSSIANEWVRRVSLEKGLSEQVANESRAKIYTYGSFRLGVHSPGSDIDTLCVGPRHVQREDFFGSFQEILRADPEVTKFSAVPDAFVPIMKFLYSGVDIDFAYASLDRAIIPEDLDLLDENNLKNLDEATVRSINGCRVTDKILRLVPNIPNFRLTLRAIRVWAKRRGVYSNVLGFLAGISIALLTARICQLWPNAAPNTLVHAFFRLYEQWKWPNPVILTEITSGTLQLNLKYWDPQNHYRDRNDLMPVITPAYPCMNSTYNVSQSTLSVLRAEYEVGKNVVTDIIQKKASWEDLFSPHEFFYKYRIFMQVDAVANSPENLIKWTGWVESKIRVFVKKLEFTPCLKTAHPHPTSFESKKENWSHCISWFVGLKFEPNSGSVNLTPPVVDFTQFIRSWDCRDKEGMDIKVRYLKWANLPEAVFGPSGRKPIPKRKAQRKRKAKSTPAATSRSNDTTNKSVTTPTPTPTQPTPTTPPQKKQKIEETSTVQEQSLSSSLPPPPSSSSSSPSSSSSTTTNETNETNTPMEMDSLPMSKPADKQEEQSIEAIVAVKEAPVLTNVTSGMPVLQSNTMTVAAAIASTAAPPRAAFRVRLAPTKKD